MSEVAARTCRKYVDGLAGCSVFLRKTAVNIFWRYCKSERWFYKICRVRSEKWKKLKLYKPNEVEHYLTYTDFKLKVLRN